MIGSGEWFPPHPPRGDGLGSKVSFSGTTTGPTHPVGAAPPHQERSRGRWLTVRGERQGGRYLVCLGSVQVREVGRSRGNVEHRRCGFAFASCGRSFAPPDHLHHLRLDGDQRFRSCDPIRRRASCVLGKLRHVHSAAPQPQRHHAGLHCPSQGEHNLTPSLSPIQRPSIYLGQLVFQRWHDTDIRFRATVSSPKTLGFLKDLRARLDTESALCLTVHRERQTNQTRLDLPGPNRPRSPGPRPP